MSAYYAADATAPVTEQSTPAPVLVAFAGPAPQSRLTVAFRIFMAIPQLIVLWLLGVAAIVITIIGWFGALFTGRLPVFAADFLTGYLRWLSRVYAYNYLLTDVYPPFTLDDADYPVRLAVTPGRLNRLAVLFRFFLLIPCWIVQAVVSYGALTIFMFVTWLIVLVTGQMPDAIHQALAAVLRYQVRTLGFAVMLTSAYPGGLFGDPPAQAQGYAAQPGYGRQPGYGAAAGVRRAAGVRPGRLRRAGRGNGGRAVLAARAVRGGAQARDPVHRARRGARRRQRRGPGSARQQQRQRPVRGGAGGRPTSPRRVTRSTTTRPTCRRARSKLSCVEGLDRKVAGTLNTFAGQLRGTAMPSQATAANAALASAVSDTAAIFAKLSTATSATQYISEAQSSGLQQSVDKINQAYDNLGTALSS